MESIHFGNVQIDKVENGHHFQIQVFVKGSAKENVLVELYANGINDAKPERIKMEPDSNKSSNAEEHFYQAMVETERKATDFTVRIIPNYEGISVPLEDNLICWQLDLNEIETTRKYAINNKYNNPISRHWRSAAYKRVGSRIAAPRRREIQS